MNFSAKTFITAGAVFAAFNGMAWGAWRIGEYTELRPVILREFRANIKLAMDIAERNTIAIAKQEFDAIEGKKDHGAELTYEEKRDLCKNAQILDYPVDGCERNTGEPILIQKSPVK